MGRRVYVEKKQNLISDQPLWRIEIINRDDVVDAVGDGLRDDVTDLGIQSVEQARYVRLYALHGDLSDQEVDTVAAQLLADPVTQDYRCRRHDALEVESGQWGVEVWLRPGVTDAVGETTMKGVRDLGISGITAAETGRGYILTGPISASEMEMICRRLLANDVIERYQYYAG